MNKLAINVLYEYMIHELRIENVKEIEDTTKLIEKLLPHELYYEIEPHINWLISLAEKQGFARGIIYFCEETSF